MPHIELLHLLGDAPEGPWAIFSLPDGDGTDMVSVVVPRSLWLLVTRQNPFSSEISLMELVGEASIRRVMARGPRDKNSPIWVQQDDIPGLIPSPEEPWFRSLRICGQCHQMVPPGEVSEGLSNALPPDSRGFIEIKVLCPECQIQTTHNLTPWGIP